MKNMKLEAVVEGMKQSIPGLVVAFVVLLLIAIYGAIMNSSYSDYGVWMFLPISTLITVMSFATVETFDMVGFKKKFEEEETKE